MSNRTGKDMSRAIMYNIDVTTVPQRMSEVSYPLCRLTIFYVTANRRVVIGNGDEIKVAGKGFEIQQNVRHIVCEDPSQLFITSNNDVTVMVQIERDWR